MTIHVAAYVEHFPLSGASVRQHLSAVSGRFRLARVLRINPAILFRCLPLPAGTT